MGPRLPGLVRARRRVDDSRLVLASRGDDPLRRPHRADVDAVAADVQAEREEGLRDGARAAAPAVAARLRADAGRGRGRTGAGAALGSLPPALLPAAGPL